MAQPLHIRARPSAPHTSARPRPHFSIMAPPAPSLTVMTPPPLARAPSTSELLSELPCRWGGFTEGALVHAPPPRRYLPGESDKCDNYITESPTRSLVRALRAQPFSLVTPTSTKTAKRSRDDAQRTNHTTLEDMDKKDRQKCLRVALISATDISEPLPQLVVMREKWRADPKARFRLTNNLRIALANTASKWTLEQLLRYAEAAELLADRPDASRAELLSAVRLHLGPPSSAPQPPTKLARR